MAEGGWQWGKSERIQKGSSQAAPRIWMRHWKQARRDQQAITILPVKTAGRKPPKGVPEGRAMAARRSARPEPLRAHEDWTSRLLPTRRRR